MSRMIYGTAWKKEYTKDYVVQAIQNGFRAIDTDVNQSTTTKL